MRSNFSWSIIRRRSAGLFLASAMHRASFLSRRKVLSARGLPILLWFNALGLFSRSMAMPEAPSTNPQPLKYWAFLSYSQRDKRWSDWLRRSIEIIACRDGWWDASRG